MSARDVKPSTESGKYPGTRGYLCLVPVATAAGVYLPSRMAPSKGAPQTRPPASPAGGRAKGQTPESAAEAQRKRIVRAMVEASARHGYAGTTLHELVRLAGVSKTTFYGHFKGKQECFLATFDEIIAQVTDLVSAAYLEEGDSREEPERGPDGVDGGRGARAGGGAVGGGRVTDPGSGGRREPGACDGGVRTDDPPDLRALPARSARFPR